MPLALKTLGPTLVTLALCGALLAGGVGEAPWDLEPPAPVETDAPVHVGDLEGLACASCHEAVANEWASSMHAFAWIDPIYQEALAGARRPESCTACHVPAPLHARGLDERPRARTEDLRFGVSCQACHLDAEGTVLGPRGAPNGAHPSKRAESFVGAGTNALCSACHATFVGPVLGVARDFEEAGLAAEGATCVGCHMAPLERSWGREQDGSEAPVRAGRSHALQTPRDPSFLRRAFGLTASERSGVTVLEVANRAGHRVPGLIGRSLHIEAVLLDAAGAELGRGELWVDSEDPLPVRGSLRIEIPGRGRTLRVRGRHVDPRLLEPVPFLDEELTLGA